MAPTLIFIAAQSNSTLCQMPDYCEIRLCTTKPQSINYTDRVSDVMQLLHNEIGKELAPYIVKVEISVP